jgi:hypothetical protein
LTSKWLNKKNFPPSSMIELNKLFHIWNFIFENKIPPFFKSGNLKAIFYFPTFNSPVGFLFLKSLFCFNENIFLSNKEMKKYFEKDIKKESLLKLSSFC